MSPQSGISLRAHYRGMSVPSAENLNPLTECLPWITTTLVATAKSSHVTDAAVDSYAVDAIWHWDVQRQPLNGWKMLPLIYGGMVR